MHTYAVATVEPFEESIQRHLCLVPFRRYAFYRCDQMGRGYFSAHAQALSVPSSVSSWHAVGRCISTLGCKFHHQHLFFFIPPSCIQPAHYTQWILCTGAVDRNSEQYLSFHVVQLVVEPQLVIAVLADDQG